MKESKHQNEAFETALEQIEQIIEQIAPTSTVRISDITGRLNPQIRNGDINRATIMLLKKYGISFE